MKKIAVVFLLLAMLLLCGCGKSSPQTAEICFDFDPSAGCEWYSFQSSDLFRIEKNAADGQVRFTLTPVKPGDCEVSFVYQKPGEAMELGDTYSYQMTVSKAMQIKVNGGTAGISGDFDTLPVFPEMTVK